MKPATFTYHAPATLAEALRLLAEFGDTVKVLAGGQSLVPLMNFRLVRPEHVVDIGRVAALRYIQDEDGFLRTGALTTHAEIECSPLFQARCPLAPAAARHIGHSAIRNRGTVGGSVAHADPSAEWPLVLTCTGGSIVTEGPGGRRTIPAREFFLGYLTTALLPGELVVEVQFPALPAGAGWSFQEIARRHGDFALVAAAAVVTLDGAGRIGSARLALAGASPAPMLVEAVNILRGERPTEAALRQVAAEAVRDLSPESDLHAPAEYRREVAGVLARRTLTEAVRRAGGEVT